MFEAEWFNLINTIISAVFISAFMTLMFLISRHSISIYGKRDKLTTGKYQYSFLVRNNEDVPIQNLKLCLEFIGARGDTFDEIMVFAGKTDVKFNWDDNEDKVKCFLTADQLPSRESWTIECETSSNCKIQFSAGTAKNFNDKISFPRTLTLNSNKPKSTKGDKYSPNPWVLLIVLLISIISYWVIRNVFWDWYAVSEEQSFTNQDLINVSFIIVAISISFFFMRRKFPPLIRGYQEGISYRDLKASNENGK